MWLTFFMCRAIFLGKIFSCAFLVQKLINTYNRLILSCPLCLTGIASTTTMSILRLDGERSLPLDYHQIFSSRWTHWNSQLSNYTPPDISPQTYGGLFSSKTQNLDSERLFKMFKSKSNRYGSLLIPNVGSIRTEFLMACAAGLGQNVLLIGEQVARDDDDDSGSEDGTYFLRSRALPRQPWSTLT